MTERWERELRRIGHVPAPVDEIRARADRGPVDGGGPTLPPPRQRVLAGVVAFGVFIAAGIFLVRAFQPGSSGTPGDERPAASQLVVIAHATNDAQDGGSIDLTADGAAVIGATGGS